MSKEFDDFGNPFDPEDEGDEFEDGLEEEGNDEERDGEGDEEENGEENGGNWGNFGGNHIETDPGKQVLGECSLCGTEVTQGWLDQWGAVGKNGWEAFKICPNCQAGAFFENGGHF
jgi:hypothetical protein